MKIQINKSFKKIKKFLYMHRRAEFGMKYVIL